MLRLEDKNGNGIYTAGNLEDWMPQCEERHPTPYDDTKLRRAFNGRLNSRIMSYYKFGFVNHQQFREWFFSDQTIKNAYTRGFKLVEYTGQTVVGYTQCMMKIDSMMKICEWTLDDALGKNKK